MSKSTFVALAAALIFGPAANLITSAQAYEPADGWYIKPYLGYMDLSNTAGQSSGIQEQDTIAKILPDSGGVAGLGIGFRYNDFIAAEVAWQYSRSDHQSTFTDGTAFDGDFAANALFVNGYYFIDSKTTFRPYVGLGLGWAQEIDLDFNSGGVERSYTTSGDPGLHLMLGAEYEMLPGLSLQTELGYASFPDLDMKSETDSSRLFLVDYQPITLQAALRYRF